MYTRERGHLYATVYKQKELTHGFENQVNILVVLSPDDIQELNDVWVFSKFLQEKDQCTNALDISSRAGTAHLLVWDKEFK